MDKYHPPDYIIISFYVLGIMGLGTDIVELADRWGFELKVSLPVVVTDVNADKSLVACRPAVLDRTMQKEQRMVEFPEHVELLEVPVAHYSTSKGYVWVNIEPKTHGRIIFGDVDLQRYVNTGEVLDPASARFHDWNDSYFVPGEFSYARRIDPIDADVALSSLDGTSFIAIKKGGVVRISAATELQLNAPIVSLNGIAFTSMNPVFNSPIFGYAEPVVPGTPEEPKEVRR